MLQNSDQFSSSDDVLLSYPHTGFAYQLAAALGRLGKKVTGLFSSKNEFESLKELALRCVEYSFESPPLWEQNTLSSNLFALRNFVLSFNEPLAKNIAPSSAHLDSSQELCRKLVEKYPGIHLSIVLPEATPPSFVNSLMQIAPASTTLFLTPALYGLRDNFLFDHLFSLEPADVAKLKTPFTTPASIRAAFVADVVAFVISTLGQERLKGKRIRVPATEINLEELASTFATEHSIRMGSSSLFDSIKGYLSRENPLETFLKTHAASINENIPPTASKSALLTDSASNSSHNTGEGRSDKFSAASADRELFTSSSIFENAPDLFPSNLTQMDRALKMSFQSRSRFPELNSHFPPSRSL